jgi:cobalt/nickel transport system ATP-binding protein
MSCSLEAQNIGYQIYGKTLFEDISFTLGHKEKLIIKGSNGSGKSTLLKILGGLKQPSSGNINLFHNKMTDIKSFSPYRKDIGFLFQDSDNQFLAPTVLEDVAFGLLNLGIAKQLAKEMSLEILERFGIASLKDSVAFKLSGGQKKLVALASVLILEPKILLLDEPSSGLDDKSTQLLLEIIIQTDASSIVVSHDKDFTARLGFASKTLENGHLF